ncbi:MAG: hypothetical protein BroJett030_25280 [Alphaproteobacteria bacterium]|nr:MAG: hypothetical protein BroJett030_25280 [Alphaproteobacteria bacterium]
MIPRLFVCLVLLSLFPTTSGAQNITAGDPDSVVKAMQEIGYRAELKKDGEGDPMIASAAGGYKFVVFFYGCEEGATCDTFQFHSSFNADGEVTDEAINDWNSKRRFAKAYFDDEKDVVLVMDIVMIEAGLSDTVFREAMSIWEDRLTTFAKEIGF